MYNNRGIMKNNIELNINDSVNVETGTLYGETLIEQRLWSLCKYNEKTQMIFYEWRANKQKYIKKTATTVLLFSNYSMHDKSHSERILECIEMFLGKERIMKLEIGDLWLLLNCAYGHDIGMAVKDAEMQDIWINDREFQYFLINEVNDMESNAQDAILYYRQLGNLIFEQDQMYNIEKKDKRIKEFNDDWALIIRKNIGIIIGEYIRKKHAERSSEFFNNFFEEIGIEQAENRLYLLVAQISYAHNANFDYILKKMKYEADGFGNEKLHPQFVAAMIRLGDILDMDNKRFDPNVLDFFGELPEKSKVHYQKHNSIKHLKINEREIEAEGRTTNVQVCKELLRTFQQLESEIKNITNYWNSIIPSELGGCLFKNTNLKVYLNDNLYENTNEKNFKVDKLKLMKLLMGDNIYNTKMNFIREYIQNALDATKMHIWREYSKGNLEYFINEEYANKFTPFSLKIDYINKYTIKVNLMILKNNRLRISIIDKGIGMDEECIEAISTIGKGWRGRKKFQDDFNNIVGWLKPTGGFGIGLQSGFMVTDTITIISHGIDEIKGYEISLKSPSVGGDITMEEKNNLPEGTTVHLDIDIFDILDADSWLKSTKNKDIVKQPFNYDWLLEEVCNEVTKYLEESIINNFIPICISYENQNGIQNKYIRGKILNNIELINKENTNIHCHYDDEEEYFYGYVYEGDNKSNIIIGMYALDCKDYTYCQSDFLSNVNEIVEKDTKNKGRERIQYAFKSVKVDQIKGELVNGLYGVIDKVLIDFMGKRTEECLNVNRNSFIEGFNETEDILKFNNFFAKKILKSKSNRLFSSNVISLLTWKFLLSKEKKYTLPDIKKIDNETFIGLKITKNEFTNNSVERIIAAIKAFDLLNAIIDKQIIIIGYKVKEPKADFKFKISQQEDCIKDEDVWNLDFYNKDDVRLFKKEINNENLFIITDDRLKLLFVNNDIFSNIKFCLSGINDMEFQYVRYCPQLVEEIKNFNDSISQMIDNELYYIASEKMKNKQFDVLKVKKVPLLSNKIQNKDYILVPFGKEVFNRLKNDEDMKLKTFNKFVIERDYYNKIIKWIIQYHQCGKMVTKSKIEQAYSELLIKIYKINKEINEKNDI